MTCETGPTRVGDGAAKTCTWAGPFIAATDNMRIVADQIRQWVPGRYVVLGTDGYGRSDTREALRRLFEVDRKAIVVSALKALADDERVPAQKVDEAIRRYAVDAGAANPWER